MKRKKIFSWNLHNAFRIRRNHKDVLFVRLFQNKKDLLALYNALKKYGTKLVTFPKPRYVIFYNGTEAHEDVEEFKLSDAFGGDDSCLELKATMYNINFGHNKKLMEQCKALSDYAYFISRIRYYNTEKSYSIEQAVDTACMECIKKDILRNFLLKNRSEVMDMFMIDYHPSLLRKMDREDGYEDGFADGKSAGLSEGESVGFTKGELEKQKQIVKNMICHGMTDKEIMTLTDCPQELIDDLRK